MSDESIVREKRALRLRFRERRREISETRRLEAQEKLLSDLLPRLLSHEYVLSFMSQPEEIDLFALNFLLAEKGKLILPRVQRMQFTLYKVRSLQDLLPSARWNILEPDPEKCVQAFPSELSFVLVPGLSFDHHFHRLGQGLGYYDRFLSDLPPEIPTCGIGFSEQFSKEPLPIQMHDWPLTEVVIY